MCVGVCVCLCVNVHSCVHMQREGERERWGDIDLESQRKRVDVGCGSHSGEPWFCATVSFHFPNEEPPVLWCVNHNQNKNVNEQRNAA